MRALTAALTLCLPSSSPAAEDEGWEQVPGKAKDVGIGPDGEAWVIGLDAVENDFPIFRWKGQEWERVAGWATAIAVGKHGKPWVVNSEGSIFQWK